MCNTPLVFMSRIADTLSRGCFVKTTFASSTFAHMIKSRGRPSVTDLILAVIQLSSRGITGLLWQAYQSASCELQPVPTVIQSWLNASSTLMPLTLTQSLHSSIFKPWLGLLKAYKLLVFDSQCRFRRRYGMAAELQTPILPQRLSKDIFLAGDKCHRCRCSRTRHVLPSLPFLWLNRSDI